MVALTLLLLMIEAANWRTIRSRIWRWFSASNTDYFICLDLWKTHCAKEKSMEQLEERKFKLNLEFFLIGRKEGDSYRRFPREVYRRAVSDNRRGDSALGIL